MTTAYNAELLEYLHWEVFTTRYDKDTDTIRVYITDWEYAEPEIIHNNDELLTLFREIVESAYSGIEDFIPEEYSKYLA